MDPGSVGDGPVSSTTVRLARTANPSDPSSVTSGRDGGIETRVDWTDSGCNVVLGTTSVDVAVVDAGTADGADVGVEGVVVAVAPRGTESEAMAMRSTGDELIAD